MAVDDDADLSTDAPRESAPAEDLDNASASTLQQLPQKNRSTGPREEHVSEYRCAEDSASGTVTSAARAAKDDV